MKKVVVISDEDYTSVLAFIHDALIYLDKIENSFSKSEVRRRLCSAEEVLKEKSLD